MKKKILLKTISEGAAYGAIAGVIVYFIGFLLAFFVKEELYTIFAYTIGFPIYISTMLLFSKGCQDLGCFSIIVLCAIIVYMLVGIFVNVLIKQFKK